MGDKPIILDGRPAQLSDVVTKAVKEAEIQESKWRAGLIDHEFHDEIRADACQAIHQAFQLPSDCRILFTSSIEEARNTAIKGLAWGASDGLDEIVTVAGDPYGFLESSVWLERFGFKSVVLPSGKVGGIAFPLLDKSVTGKTAIVALSTVTPEMYRWRIPEIRKFIANCEKHHAELVIDISTEVQGKRFEYDGSKATILCDGVALGAPDGIAFLAIRPGARLGTLISGGVEQKGLRGGWIDPALMAGLGAAVKEYSVALASSQVTSNQVPKYGIDPYLSLLRETALKELRKRIPSARLVHGEAPLPVGITFINPGVEGEAVAMLCAQEGVHVATGSDCLRRTGKVSPVLTAAGFSAEEAAGSVQLFFRGGQSVEDVKRALEVIGKAVDKLRQMR